MIWSTLPGDSWSLMSCLSENSERLWMRVKQWLVLQLVHTLGSGMRPRSSSVVVVDLHTEHLNNASRISGMMLDERITIPDMVISWSKSTQVKRHLLSSNDDGLKTIDSRLLTLRIERTHVLGLFSIERSDLDLMTEGCVGILLKEHFIDGHIKYWNYLLGIGDQLPVKCLIKMLNMGTVNIHERLFQDLNLQRAKNIPRALRATIGTRMNHLANKKQRQMVYLSQFLQI